MIERVVAGVLLALIVLGGGVFLYLRSSLPEVDGRVVVTGITARVTITRDQDGVPLVTAAGDDDAAFGLGFAHAQDRLFQMELQRRYAAGTLAEIFGEKALGVDREMRVLGLYRDAEAEIPFLSPALRQGLQAYADGVNAFLATRRGALPPEFVLLRFRPKPWRIADTLAWGKLMDLELAGNYRWQLLRAALARTVSPADLQFLFPNYPAGATTTLAALVPIYRGLPLRRLYAALPGIVGPIRASNDWVVDGQHSLSGKPLVANDPHLAFGAPGFWYLARLKTPTHTIAGATVAGAPFVVVGHNERIAWGFTNTGSDVEDLFIEKIDPKDPARYLTPDGSQPLVTRQETIAVRGAKALTITVRSTRHGPVLSDVLPAGSAAPGYVLALETSFAAPDDRSAQALWEVDRAGDWASFNAAWRDFVGPQQNVVYGDVGGTIGFIAPGRVPIRRAGNGFMPVPGWTGQYDWTGFIPFDALPRATNPPSGHFVSANNKIVPATYPYFLTDDWDLPNRAQRITELLDATPKLSPATSSAIAADTLSITARTLVPLMTRIVPQDEAERDAIDRLQHWDFHMNAAKVAPLIFTAWLRAFSHDVLFARLGSAAQDYWNLKPQVMEAVLTKRPDWCDDPKHPHTITCDERLSEALDSALARLSSGYGPDMSKWQWGRAHIAHFPNPVLGRIPVLRDLVRVEIPTSGGADTVDRGLSTIRDDRDPYAQLSGAGFRIATDLAHPTEAQMIAVPGQSGNPLSRHFADLLMRWRRLQWLVPGEARGVHTLRLVPRQSAAR